jgi:putative transposase
VWSYDFVADTTRDGRPFRILHIIDEYTRACLASHVARRIRSQDVIVVLAGLFVRHGQPVHIRSDNGPEFIARNLKTWLKNVLGAEPLCIEPDSPWENGYGESFNWKMRDQLLNRELFYTLKEAHIIIERWRIHYNTVRPHSSLGGKPPAPEAIQLVS